MASLSKAHIAVATLALVGVGASVLGLEVVQLLRAPADQSAPAVAIDKASPTQTAAAPEAGTDTSVKPAGLNDAVKQAETKVASAIGDLPLESTKSLPEESGPAFDVARIEPTGEGVIAGRAAPGSTVQLMRENEVLDSVAADASGQFVMVSPHLPAGNYELKLRATLPDGRSEDSRASVAVALNDITASTTPPPAPVVRTEQAPAPVPQVHATAVAAPAAPAEAKNATPASRMTSRVVTRGDSLWRISRLAYGDGMRYAVIYNANRERIRNPDRIYPGQTFVMPEKAR